MVDWKFGLRKLSNGLTMAEISEPSADTNTAVKHTAPLVDGWVRRACVIVRNNPDINVQQLRQELPELSRCASDPRLVDIIQSGGEVKTREFTNRLIADAAAGHNLSEETISWYRTHKSRQVKAQKRGRPRKRV